MHTPAWLLEHPRPKQHSRSDVHSAPAAPHGSHCPALLQVPVQQSVFTTQGEAPTARQGPVHRPESTSHCPLQQSVFAPHGPARSLQQLPAMQCFGLQHEDSPQLGQFSTGSTGASA
jgi:hypothetical protein